MALALECVELVKEYHTQETVRALDLVDLEIEEGEVFGLLGPNGAGKTTMFIPIQILPPVLRYTGIVFLPMSFGMDLQRHYVMGTRTVLAVPYEWAILAAQFVVYALLARIVVSWLERIARDQGLHYL